MSRDEQESELFAFLDGFTKMSTASTRKRLTAIAMDKI